MQAFAGVLFLLFLIVAILGWAAVIRSGQISELERERDGE